jgi:hypothetical protein
MNYYLVKGEIDSFTKCRKKYCNDCTMAWDGYGHVMGEGHFEVKVEAPDHEQAIKKALTFIRKYHLPKKVIYWSEDGGEQEVEFIGAVPDEIILRRKGYQTLWDNTQLA